MEKGKSIMNNWIFEILLATIFFILGIFSSDVRNYIKKSSLSWRNGRIEIIKEDYEQIKDYKENYSILVAESIRRLANVAKIFLFLLLVIGVGTLVGLRGDLTYGESETNRYIIAGLTGIVLAQLTDITRLIDKVKGFEKYKEETMKKLKKLGTTMDEEESEPNE